MQGEDSDTDESASDESEDDDDEPQTTKLEDNIMAKARSAVNSNVDQVWDLEQNDYVELLEEQAMAVYTGILDRQWLEDADVATTSTARPTLLRRRTSSSHLLPVNRLQSNLTSPGLSQNQGDTHAGGFLYVPADGEAQLQGIVVTAISMLSHLREKDGTSYVRVTKLKTGKHQSVTILEPAAIVLCQHDLPALHLTDSSVLAFVVGTSRRELVDELIMFEQTQLAEHLCMLNDWNRHTLNTHQLDSGLKYRQLDVVDSVLENLDDGQAEPAYQLLSKTVENTMRLSKGVDFAQRLLCLTNQHLSKVINRRREAGGDIKELIQCLRSLRTNMIRPQVQRKSIAEVEPAPVGTITHLPPDADETEGYDLSADIRALQTIHADEALEAEGAMYPVRYHEQFERWRTFSATAVIEDALHHGNVLAAQLYLVVQNRSSEQLAMGGDIEEDYFQSEIGDGDDTAADDRCLSNGSLSSSLGSSVGSIAKAKALAAAATWKKNAGIGGKSLSDESIADDEIPAPELWSYNHFHCVSLDLVFKAVSNNDVALATTMLENLGEDSKQHLQYIYANTSRPDVRDILKAAEACAGDKDYTYIQELLSLYPSEDINDCLSTMMKKRPPDATALVEARWTADAARYKNMSGVWVGGHDDASAVPSAPVLTTDLAKLSDMQPKKDAAEDDEDEASLLRRGGKFYCQVLARWVALWDKTTRERVLLDALTKEELQGNQRDKPSAFASCYHAMCHASSDALPALVEQLSPADCFRIFEVHAASFKKQMLYHRLMLTNHIHFGSGDHGTIPWRTLARTGKLFSHHATWTSTPASPAKNGAAHAANATHKAFLEFAVCNNLFRAALRYAQCQQLFGTDLAALLPEFDVNVADASDLMASFAWAHALPKILAIDHGGTVVDASLANARLVASVDPSVDITLAWLMKSHLHKIALATLVFDRSAFDSHATLEPGGALHSLRQEFLQIVSLCPLLHTQFVSSSTTSLSPRVSIYNLLESCTNYNVLELFEWQHVNENKKASQPEMPHFSGTMTDLYAETETLDYTYYLVQGRPFQALATYQAVADDVPKATLANAVQTLAVTNFREHKIGSACLLFLELVHEDGVAEVLRDELTIAQRIFAFRSRAVGTTFNASFDQIADDIVTALSAVHTADATATSDSSTNATAELIDEMLLTLEDATKWHISTMGGSSPAAETSATLAASREWRLVNRFSRRCGRSPRPLFLLACAKAGAWFQFLSFAQSEGIGTDDVGHLATAFPDPAVRQHLQVLARRMFGKVPGAADRLMVANGHATAVDTASPAKPRGQSAATSILSVEKDLFSIMFQCHCAGDPAEAYLERAVSETLPILAVFAACEGADTMACLCAWLYATHPDLLRRPVSSVVWSRQGTWPPAWSRDHLLVIIETLCANALTRNVRESLALFPMNGSSLHLVIKFIEAFEKYDFDAASSQLKKYMVALSDAGIQMGPEWEVLATDMRRSNSISTDPDVDMDILDWTRKTANTLIAQMLELCATAYERKHLLRLLCEGQYSAKYERLYQTFIILSDVRKDIPADTDPQICIEMLLKRNLFDEAYAFAKAHEIEPHQVNTVEHCSPCCGV